MMKSGILPRLRGAPLLPLRPVLFLLVIPLVASFFLGYLFTGHVVQHVPTVIVDHDNSSMSRSLVRSIQTNQSFDVKVFSDRDDDVETLLYRSEATVGLIVPKDFEKDLLIGKNPRVLAVYDGSQMSMTGAAKSRLAEVLGTVRAGFLMQVSEGKLGLQPQASTKTVLPMSYTIRILGNPSKSTASFLLEGALFAVVLVALAMVGIELVEGASRYRQVWLRGLLAGLPGLLSLFLVLVTQSGVFGVPFEGTVPAALVLMLLFAWSVTALGTFLVLLTRNTMAAVSIGGFLSAMMLFAGYTFPLFAMPDAFQAFAWLLPFTHFGLPMRDIALVGRTVDQVMPDALWLAGCAVVLWLANFALFSRYQRAHS
jgi:ABC-2 type transport system permease protein